MTEFCATPFFELAQPRLQSICASSKLKRGPKTRLLRQCASNWRSNCRNDFAPVRQLRQYLYRVLALAHAVAQGNQEDLPHGSGHSSAGSPNSSSFKLSRKDAHP